MIFKHKIYFFFWKIWMWLLGYGVGEWVNAWSYSKQKYINGFVCGYTGDSVDSSTVVFFVHVIWNRPFIGDDPTFFKEGWYKEDSLLKLNKGWVL